MTEPVVQTDASPMTIVGLDSSGNRQSQGMVGNAVKSTTAAYVKVITPSDVTEYDPPLIGLRVGTTAGDITVISDGNTVLIPNWQLYESLEMLITKVMADGTTAVGINGWQGS